MTCDGCANATKRILSKMEGEVALPVTLERSAVWKRSLTIPLATLYWSVLPAVAGTRYCSPGKKRRKKESLVVVCTTSTSFPASHVERSRRSMHSRVGGG
ncbi:unnamed protein product [Ectocarpus sp. 13 AM-2016]